MEAFTQRYIDSKTDLEVGHEFPFDALEINNRAEDATLPNRLLLYETSLNVSVDETYLPVKIGIEPLSGLTLSPIEVGIKRRSETHNGQIERTVQLDLRTDETTPIHFRIYLRSDSVEGFQKVFEFRCPPIGPLNWAEMLLKRRFDSDTFEHLSEHYQAQEKAHIMSKFLWDIIN